MQYNALWMQHNVVGQCILLAVLMMISLQVAALMMIDMNGPDIEAVDEVKAPILESVNTCKNYKKGAVKGLDANPVNRATGHPSPVPW